MLPSGQTILICFMELPQQARLWGPIVPIQMGIRCGLKSLGKLPTSMVMFPVRQDVIQLMAGLFLPEQILLVKVAACKVLFLRLTIMETGFGPIVFQHSYLEMIRRLFQALV